MPDGLRGPIRSSGSGSFIGRAWLWLAVGVALLSSGCASQNGLSSGPGYYWQSVSGHLALMRAARPIDDWLADSSTAEPLKARLVLSQRMRRFAVSELALPDNASYTRYADLKRRAVVWNVVAAPEFSLTLQNWCFPLLGCVGYRGYFNEAEAEAYAAELRSQGLDAAAYPVPAYSTLGWMNWMGGDPLLSTFAGYPEGELARLMFHELAHQVLYAPDDTMFNESFATAVERIGGQRWLDQHASPAARQAFADFDQRRRQFRDLTRSTRQNLSQIYALALDGNRLSAIDHDATLRAKKSELMADFRQRYQALKATWGGYAGYDEWVARANNATFGVQAAYDDLVPAFEVLFAQQGGSFPRFYDAVRVLVALPKDQRHHQLRALLPTQAAPVLPPLKEAPHG